MNDEEIQKFFESLKRQQLSKDERAQLRETLVLRARGYQPMYREIVRTRFFYIMQALSRPVVYVSIAVLVISGSGISYAAEGSLPGSFLYPIKINVTEPLRVAFSFSPEAQAHIEAQFAERRLAEATLLSAQGRLTVQTSDWLFEQASQRTAAFQEDLAQAGETIDQVRAAEEASHLEASLEAHVALSQAVATTTPSIEKLRDSVQSASAVRAQAERNAEKHSPEILRQVSEDQLRKAEVEYTKARQLFEGRSDSLAGSAASNTASELDTVHTTLDESHSKLQSGDYQETFSKLLEARRTARSAEIILKATPERNETRLSAEVHNQEDRPSLPDSSRQEGGD